MLKNPEIADVLLAPLSINEVLLSNRIIMSPMAALAPHDDGRPSEQTIAFLRERAKGGVGLIIMGGSAATARAFDEAPVKGVVRFDDDRFVPDLKRLTDSEGDDAHPFWSPDGTRILWGSSRFGFKDEAPLAVATPQPYAELFIMNADGSDQRPLTDNQYEDGTPAWLPSAR